jgi:hypothetical protein
MPTNLQYMLLEKPGDREFAIKMLAAYNQLDNAGLVAAYNSAWKVGIVGSHAQAVSYYALHIAFTKRFGKSPILIKDKIILSLTDLITVNGDSWNYNYSTLNTTL